jgi:glycosyltransferase involved in cell wall biosynthesis
MKIAYYTTIPPPPISGTESVFNEIRILMDYFDGQRIDLYPFKKLIPQLPWQLFGLHRFYDLIQLDRVVDIHHIFSPRLQPFPVLQFLRKPVVYTIVSSIYPLPEHLRWPKFTLVVGSERDLITASKLGIKNCRFVRHGIDTSRMQKNPLMLKNELTLLSASAPWADQQFQEKGFDLLFDVISRKINLRLIILTRGILTDELKQRLKLFDIEDRVTVIDKFVDINIILSKTHGTIVMAENQGAIRATPHSLIESLAAGKPVLISDTIPMADYVRDRNVGCIVKDHSIQSLNTAIDVFIDRYDVFRTNAEAIGGKDFSKEKMIADYTEVYEEL